MTSISETSKSGYNRLLLLVAGVGGLLYGIDIGIMDPALGYLGKTISMTEENKSVIVAAVLGGSMFASVIAGFFAALLGRKLMMLISGVMFVASVAIIFTSQSYVPLLLGRILQGMSGGVIAVVVPLYLAECLKADAHGKGTSIFQFMLTFGIVVAAFIGDHYTKNAEAAITLANGNEDAIVTAANYAWRGMFLSVIYPGILFLIGGFFLSDSPRWLYRKGRKQQAREAMLRSRTVAETDFELAELESSLAHEHAKPKVTLAESLGEIFTQRKYVVPFIIACVVLGCTQATGINSILGWLNELAFAPVDYNPKAPADEWSGDQGVSALYFSQQAVNKLLPAAKIKLPETMDLPERLKEVQAPMAKGDERAAKIYETIGIYLGYTIPHYADFYDYSHLLILGRVTTGHGGDIVLSKAREVLEQEFPETARAVAMHVPDEKTRRVGQAVAAASLPKIKS